MDKTNIGYLVIARTNYIIRVVNEPILVIKGSADKAIKSIELIDEKAFTVGLEWISIEDYEATFGERGDDE